MKASAVKWPVITIGKQSLTVRWTFYAQWLLSKRGVNVKDLPQVLKDRDVGLVNTIVECFAAAVAENFKAMNLPAPDADYWAGEISDASMEGEEDLWLRVNAIIWEAVKKAPLAGRTPAAPQATAAEPETASELTQ